MRRFIFFAAISALALFSCTKTQTPPADGEVAYGSDTITPAGGVYDLGAVRIDVPEGAVDRDVEVRVEYSPAAPEMDGFKDAKGVTISIPGTALSMIEFGPDGVSFKDAVVLEGSRDGGICLSDKTCDFLICFPTKGQGLPG